jgi:hypothetical protein
VIMSLDAFFVSRRGCRWVGRVNVMNTRRCGFCVCFRRWKGDFESIGYGTRGGSVCLNDLGGLSSFLKIILCTCMRRPRATLPTAL